MPSSSFTTIIISTNSFCFSWSDFMLPGLLLQYMLNKQMFLDLGVSMEYTVYPWVRGKVCPNLTLPDTANSSAKSRTSLGKFVYFRGHQSINSVSFMLVGITAIIKY